MIIKELRLKNFGKFKDKVITFDEGLNLIYGMNEAGKSTIHSFIQGMLFGIEKPRGKVSLQHPYYRYEPLHNKNYFEGSMDIEIEGKNYRIYRSFTKTNKEFSITDLETGRILPFKEENLSEFYGGLTESNYGNTLSIGQQKVRTAWELKDELRNYITNLSLTKSSEVDVTRALESLTKKKKQLEKTTKGDLLIKLKGDIEHGYEIEKKREDLSKRLSLLEEVHNQSTSSRSLNHIEKMMMEATSYEIRVDERIKRYEDDRDLITNKEEELSQLEYEIEQLELEYRNPKRAQSAIQEFEKKRIYQKEQEDYKHKKEEELLQLKNSSNTTLSPWYGLLLLLSFLGMMICIFLKQSIYAFLFGGLLVIGLILFILNVSKVSKIRQGQKLAIGRLAEEINHIAQVIKGIYKEQEIILQDQKVSNFTELYDIIEGCNLWDKAYTLKENRRKAMEEEINFKKVALEKELKELGHLLDGFEKVIQEVESILEGLMIVEKSVTSREPMDGYLKQVPLFDEKGFTYNEKESSEYSSVLQKNGMDIHSIIRRFFELNTRKSKVTDRKSSLNSNQEANVREKERISLELEQYANNEELIYERERLLKETLEEQQRVNMELEAITLAIHTMEHISQTIHDGFSSKLNDFVGKTISDITGNAYGTMKVDENLQMKVWWEDYLLEIERLSVGTVEQIYLALRLGISELLFEGKVYPFLFDDSFAYYDDERVKNVLKLLSAKENQVLIFTCHQREGHILDQLGIDYCYLNLLA